MKNQAETERAEAWGAIQIARMKDEAGRNGVLDLGLGREALTILTAARASIRSLRSPNISAAPDLPLHSTKERRPGVALHLGPGQNTEVALVVIPLSPGPGSIADQEAVLTVDQGHEGQVDLAPRLVITVHAALLDLGEDRAVDQAHGQRVEGL